LLKQIMLSPAKDYREKRCGAQHGCLFPVRKDVARGGICTHHPNHGCCFRTKHSVARW